VAVITAAEDRANQVLDSAINSLTDTRNKIIAGAAAAAPTVSAAVASGIRLFAIDPNSDAAWKGNGVGTVGLLIKRLSSIRGTIGSGSFFFTCLGPVTGTIGKSLPGPICTGANAASAAGTFRIDFCPPFWREGAEQQAETLLHESSHNFARFIVDRGREGNAGCYSRCAQIIAGVGAAFQRADLCPDP
jgi:hypothetical protein